MIQLRQVSRYVYDVFAGNGYDGWSRVRKFHWGVNVVAGNSLNRQECKALDAVIKAYPYGGIDAIGV